jgi:hypothetical protein
MSGTTVPFLRVRARDEWNGRVDIVSRLRSRGMGAGLTLSNSTREDPLQRVDAVVSVSVWRHAYCQVHVLSQTGGVGSWHSREHALIGLEIRATAVRGAWSWSC